MPSLQLRLMASPSGELEDNSKDFETSPISDFPKLDDGETLSDESPEPPSEEDLPRPNGSLSLESKIKVDPFQAEIDEFTESDSEPDSPESPTYEQIIETSLEGELKLHKMADTPTITGGHVANPEVNRSQLDRPLEIKTDKEVCSVCHHFPAHVKDLKQHERMCGRKQRPSCPTCGEQFTSNAALSKHKKSSHSAIKVTTTARKPRPKEEEVQVKAEAISWSCKECADIFMNSSSLRQHQKLVHINMVGCDLLTATPDVNRSLRRRNDSMNSCSPISPMMSPPHKRTRYPSSRRTITPTLPSSRNESLFKCELCERSFNSKPGRYLHYQSFHSGVDFVCHICSRSCTTKQRLKQHMKQSHNLSREEVNERFPDKRKLKKHLSNTFHEVPIQVPKSIPSRKPKSQKDIARFEELFVLKRRSSVESDEQKENEQIECQVCGMEFEEKTEFTKHVTKKHRAKFRRSVDGRQLDRRRTLPLSRADAVSLDISSDSTDSDFPCRHCERVFETKANRIVHERLHTGEKPFQCSVCQKSFACFTYLTSHLELAHDLLKG